jgi:alkanesulfonate monooxygenase SsuD/methylene tetrahydromethanopterin reductase-like flavin-dependent oxidoreductase (luciferase family)
MDFGLMYEIPVARPWSDQSEYDAYQQMIEQVVLADRLGWSSVWCVEHHFLAEYSHCSAPEVLYGNLAARTENIRLGHGVRLLPRNYNHPVRVAEQAAVLDLISDGRVEIGTGRSSTRIEIEGFGLDPSDTRPMWEEGLEVLVGSWTNDTFEYHGTYIDLPERHVVPKPLQKPHPPLWGATASDDGHEIMGRMGLGLLSFSIGVSPEDVAPRIERYRKGLAEAKPVGRFVNDRAGVFTMVHCATSMDQAEADAKQSVEWYAQTGPGLIASLGAWIEGKGLDYGTYDYTEMLKDLDLTFLNWDYLQSSGAILVGDPDRCIEIGKRYEAAGVDLLLCLVQPHSVPHEQVMQCIELMATEVMPAFS